MNTIKEAWIDIYTTDRLAYENFNRHLLSSKGFIDSFSFNPDERFDYLMGFIKNDIFIMDKQKFRMVITTPFEFIDSCEMVPHVQHNGIYYYIAHVHNSTVSFTRYKGE